MSDMQEKRELGTVQAQDITEEMTSSYLDYAMSVIVSRALPDARDGLKPVQRRILFAMREMGLSPQAKLVKSARVVGEVLGKFHPHGDQAVYDAMVRMAQDFSLRYPLLQGQGNFGSVDGDLAAAMRYTEIRPSTLAPFLLDDIDKETVAFGPNYDGTRREPHVVPAAFPNLLVNGALGIAVGMSTAIPPHNLSEVVDACLALLQKPKLSGEDLTTYIKGPDFPTGGIIFNAKELAGVYAQGKGPVAVRGRADIEIGERKTARIVISEIPFEVRKSAILEEIAVLVRDRKLEGIRDVRDESDKEGIRVVVELRQDAAPQAVLSSLFKYTDLQRTFHVNLLALEGGIRPKLYSLKEALEEFLAFRKEVVHKRSAFLLARAKERLHILEGLAKAISHIDAVVKTIRASRSRDDAHRALRAKFKFSDAQTAAILSMPLASLARLEREKILAEAKEKRAVIAELEDILVKPASLLRVVRKELAEVKERFGDERKTEVRLEPLTDITLKDLIPQAQTVIVLTTDGYIKRLAPSSFRVQHRGGRGMLSAAMRESEAMAHVAVAHTHDQVMLFTDRGKMFSVRAYEIPEASRTSRGRALVNFIALAPKEEVRALVAMPERSLGFLVLGTKKGLVKRVASETFHAARKKGIAALSLGQEDALVFAARTSGQDHLLLCTKKGQALRFSEKEVRAMGRQAAGLRAIRLRAGDEVAGLVAFPEAKREEVKVLLVGEKGFGKLVPASSFRKQKRGGVGLRAMPMSQRTGVLVGAGQADAEAQEVFAVSQKGLALRLPIKDVKTLSRQARGVRLMRLEEDDAVLAVRVL